MPNIGDIKRGKNIGLKTKSSKYIWHACVNCGKERWAKLWRGTPQSIRCANCSLRLLQKSNNGHPYNWKGGRFKTGDGYIKIRLYSNDFFYLMGGKNHCAMEHRLVMAKHMRRCLLPWEIAHHINGIKDDNRLENLTLLPHKKYHLVDTETKSLIKRLEKRVTILEVENILLKEQIKESYKDRII